ncbi:substrate-binding domain-containing protein [Enterovirga sp.]|uniref:substrate-binding domain-containing protein n=1 Tax=Enterovirga sp. TaxID=2026350 RepID=UPI0026257368|nr:substrate-binding domain-containing protein [Enterovirga sp.]MDB5592153.1 transcriptional regulator of molybdate metabolism, LysR family [Enterovirga sp.]
MTDSALWLDGNLELGRDRLSVRQTGLFLEALAQEPSLRAAADRIGISYRSAWDRLARLEAAFGRPLVVKTKGHGTSLNAAGEALRAALDEAQSRLGKSLAEDGERLRLRVAALVTAQRPPTCRMALSHDPVLVDLLAGMPDVEAAVVGSEEALRRLRAGDADLAGFHLGPGAGGRNRDEAVLRDPALHIVALFRRQQGLLVAPGNPLGIGSVRDLGRPGLRFVNRQRGSGTRGWTDHLLAEAGVDPASVRGYGNEEFTHAAVAAMVAAGMADAGMGVRVAAERFGLGFVAQGEEVYRLAARRGEVPAAAAEILARLQPAREDAG